METTRPPGPTISWQAQLHNQSPYRLRETGDQHLNPEPHRIVGSCAGTKLQIARGEGERDLEISIIPVIMRNEVFVARFQDGFFDPLGPENSLLSEPFPRSGSLLIKLSPALRRLDGGGSIQPAVGQTLLRECLKTSQNGVSRANLRDDQIQTSLPDRPE
jgi:hypothetical protein